MAAAYGEKKNGGSLIFVGRSLGKLGKKKIQISDSPEILRFVSILKFIWAVHLVM